MTFGSLFSGIGGFDLGLERAGMRCSWQVEIDDYANRVLEKHWPAVKRYRDVREVGSQNLESVDLICGGFPCQPHSLAGKRQASADERDLWGEFARIIRELRPRYVVAENVPGLLSSESGRFFGRVLRDLAACGYDAEWECIPASAFGAPHRRDRVWIVAYSKSERIMRETRNVSQEDGRSKNSLPRIIECSSDVSNANSNGRRLQQITRGKFKTETNVNDDGTQESVAHTDGKRWREERQFRCDESEERIASGSQKMADPNGSRCKGYWDSPFRGKAEYPMSIFSSWWAIEPDVGRVAHGIPKRVDRLKCLGNAVVPQVVEWIGKQIIERNK